MPANYVLLERIELNASAASVTFSNIPQSGYTDLKIVMSARSTYVSTFDFIQIRFNGSTTGYSARALYGTGSSALSASLSVLYAGDIPAVNATSSTFGNHEFYVPNYLGNTNKSVSFDSVAENNATAGYQFLTAGLWSNTAAINSIEMFSGNSQSFVAGSTFSLYGLAAVGTTPVIAPKASGGNITTDGTYWYHTFTTTGTFTPQVGLACDALVVAGGGGGGRGQAGGGGAGGFLGFSSQSLSTATTITVGAGGAGALTDKGTNGSNSQIASLTAAIGGGGGAGGGVAAGNGGSGGGAGTSATNFGTGTSGQGNNGGTGIGAPSYSSGGGGGAGAVGGNASGEQGGNGGNGLNTYSSWATATSTGASGYYAGGGGAGRGGGGTTNATGGLGGGGLGAIANQNGGAATVNTGGGGGGGGGQDTGNFYGGAGGSGIVIIRYPIA